MIRYLPVMQYIGIVFSPHKTVTGLLMYIARLHSVTVIHFTNVTVTKVNFS